MAKRAKQSKEAQTMQAWADNALAKLPAKTADRNLLFTTADRLKAAQQAAAGECSAHRKRMTDRFGLTKETIKIRDILTKCKDGVYEATISQLQLLLDDIGRPIQLDMFAPKPGEAAPPVDEPDIPLETVEADFPEVEEPAKPKRRGRPPKAVKEAADRAEARSEKIANANKHLTKKQEALPLDVAKTEFENARISAEKKRRGPAQAMKESAAESEEFLAKQVAKQKKPPKAPKLAVVGSNDDTFLDEQNPERQGDYALS